MNDVDLNVCVCRQTVRRFVPSVSSECDAESSSINQPINQPIHQRGVVVSLSSRRRRTYHILSVRAVRARLLMPLHSHNRRAIGQQWRSPHTRQQRRHPPPKKNKKLSYRRVTARCFLSVVILPITTQQCRNYLYDKS